MAVSAQNLIDRAREQADFASSTFLTDASWLVPCARSYAKLWKLMIKEYGKQYLLSTENLSVAANDVTTSIASVTGGVHKLIRIDFADSSRRVAFRPFELSDTTISDDASSWGGNYVRYSLEGNALRWQPIPSAAQTVRLYYIKQPALAALATNIDVLAEPWDDYIVIDLAIKMRIKEESDTSDLRMRLLELKLEIEEDAADRDIGQPTRAIDVRSADDGPYGDWEDGLP